MNWLLQIHSTQPVAHAIGVLALVCVAGMAVGSLKVRGVGLGTAGVLFAGILTGYFGKPLDHATLEFVKEFGLILFVGVTILGQILEQLSFENPRSRPRGS